jgi:hypothetical protein
VQGTVKGEVQGAPPAVEQMKAGAGLGVQGKLCVTPAAAARLLQDGCISRPACCRYPPYPDLLQDWLSTSGSPHSVIERCDFGPERPLAALEYADFSVKRRH